MSGVPHPLDRLLAALESAGDTQWNAIDYDLDVPAHGLIHVAKPLMVKLKGDGWPMLDRCRTDDGYTPVILDHALFEGDDAAMLAGFRAAVDETVAEIRREEAERQRVGLFQTPIKRYDDW